MQKLTALLGITFLAFTLGKCSSQNNEGTPQSTPAERKERRIQAQRDFIKRENESIKAYLKDRNFDWERSGTGLYFSIKRDSSNLEAIEAEDQVFYNYKIYLLNGSLLYSSAQSGTQSLVIDKQDAVIGLHQALKQMTLGDSGLFILPSHLAYGVSGDQNKVPPLTALQYELEIVNVQKSNNRK
jgi:FKBP-type peptidyl-prolyl cis-trans isomerase